MACCKICNYLLQPLTHNLCLSDSGKRHRSYRFLYLKEDKYSPCWKCRKSHFTAWNMCIVLSDVFYRFCQQIKIMYWPSCKGIEIFMENCVHWLNNTPIFQHFLLLFLLWYLSQRFTSWRDGMSEKPSLNVVAIRSISVQTWHHSL